MYSQTHRKTKFFAAAAFSILFMMLFAFIIPGMKASAATKNYTAPCTGSSIFYSGTGVTYITPDSRVTIQGQGVSAGVGKFTITVKPNTNTSQRIITLKAKKGSSGAVVDSIVITQAAAPSPQYITLPSASTAVSCVGGQVYCSVSGTKYEFLNKNVCSSRNGSYLVVQPNTGISSRSGTVKIWDGYGILRAVVTIRQNGVPRTRKSAKCYGDRLPFTVSGADYSKNEYSDKTVCEKREGSNYIIKTNTANSERTCRITFKNSSDRIIHYLDITQDKVPFSRESINGYGGSFTRQYPTTVTFTPIKTNTNTINYSATLISSNPVTYKYTVTVCGNPSTTDSRSFDINVKNPSGGYVEIIRVTQANRVLAKDEKRINSDPQDVEFTFAGPVSNTSYSNKDMFSKYTKSGNVYKFSVSQNPKTSSRKNTVTFKDKNGTQIATFTVTQDGVPPYNEEVDEGCPTLFFYRHSGAVSFEDVLTSKDNYAKHVSKYTALSQSNFAIEITANPSTSQSRSFDINVLGVRNNKKVILEIIHVTQAKHTHYYTYTMKNNIPTRKCLYCNDHDDCFSFADYLSESGGANNEKGVRDYMKLFKYAEDSKATQDMLAAYRYINKTENKSILQKIYNKLQDKYMNMYNTASDVAVFAQNDKLDKSLSIISAANHAFMFFTAGDDTAVKFSSAVKFGGDISGLVFNDYGYLSSALDTVGNALNDTIPLIRKKQDEDLKAALIDYDSQNGDYIARTPKSELNWTTVYNAIRVRCKDEKGKCLYTGEELVEAADKVFNWKAAYEAQIALNQLYTNLGYKVTVSTDGGFWIYVGNYIK